MTSLTHISWGRVFHLVRYSYFPETGFALMKSMNIAASSELVSRLSTHRRVVALADTDFTDVAAVVITAADSRSGILALLKPVSYTHLTLPTN